MKNIAKVQTDTNAGQGPTVNHIAEILNSHDIHPKKYYISGENTEDEVTRFLRQQNEPVVIIHFENYHAQRFLLNLNGTTHSNSTVVPLTEFQISQYQVRTYYHCLLYIKFIF